MQMTIKAVVLATILGFAGVSGTAAFEMFEDVSIPANGNAEPSGLANQFCLDRGFKRQIDFAFLGFGPRAKSGLAAHYDYVKCSMAVADFFGAGSMSSRGDDTPGGDPGGDDRPTPPTTHPL
jgi:hypothetical protein